MIIIRKNWFSRFGYTVLISVIWISLSEPVWGDADQSPRVVGNCGAESLTALAELSGVQIDRGDAIERLGRRGEQCSMLQIQEAAHDMGFPLAGKRIDYDQLCGIQTPVIAHLRWGHFVVIRSASINQTALIDGYDRSVVSPAETFRKQWTGYILIPEQTSWTAPIGFILLGLGVLILAPQIFRLRAKSGIESQPINPLEIQRV